MQALCSRLSRDYCANRPSSSRATRPAIAAPQPTRAPKAAKARHASKPETKGEPVTLDVGIRGDVFAALKAGPMTSLELVKKFEKQCTPGAIYLALKQLREARVVETRLGDDGEKKNVRVS